MKNPNRYLPYSAYIDKLNNNKSAVYDNIKINIFIIHNNCLFLICILVKSKNYSSIPDY